MLALGSPYLALHFMEPHLNKDHELYLAEDVETG